MTPTLVHHAVLALEIVVMTGDVRADGDRVTVRGMNQRLQLTGWQATWEVKAEIQPPMHPVPGGRMIALLKHGTTSERELVLWSKEGHELARAKLALTGEVTASRAFDKQLILVTASEVAEFETASLHPGRVRKIAVAAGKDTKYLPGPTGVWVVNDQELFYFDLDGRPPLQKKRPLALATNKPPCPEAVGSVRAPCSAGFQPQEAEMMVSDAGELLMLDVFRELYPVKPAGWSLPDQVWPSITTLLDSNGSIVAQKVSSWMKTTREWFWSANGDSHNPTPFPADWGLVRTRYTTKGIGPGRLFGSHRADFLFWSRDDKMTVHLWSRKLKPVWRRSIQELGGGFVSSPSWVSPMLFHDFRCFKNSKISDEGKSSADDEVVINEILQEKDRTHNERPRFAIGQSAQGDWLLIAY
jgi:hypothetical protein